MRGAETSARMGRRAGGFRGFLALATAASLAGRLDRFMRLSSGPGQTLGEPDAALEEEAQSVKHRSAVLFHGRYVAADGAVVTSALEGAPGPRDLLLDLHHPHISLGLVVIPADSEVAREAQHVVAPGVETGEQVEGLLLVARPFADGGFGVGGQALLDQSAVAGADRVQDRVVEVTGAGGPGGADGLFGLDQQPDHLAGPALVPHHSHGFELTDMMGIAQLVEHVVAAVGLPAVVDGDRKS